MTTGWKNIKGWLDRDDRDGRGSFEEHNECMKWFRKAHANVAWTNKPKPDELARLDSMLPLRVNRTMIDTGGSRLCHNTTDWSALVPLWKVARYKPSQN